MLGRTRKNPEGNKTYCGPWIRDKVIDSEAANFYKSLIANAYKSQPNIAECEGRCSVAMVFKRLKFQFDMSQIMTF